MAPHATKTSIVLNALKKAIVASNPSIFTDDVARALAEGPPAAHGGPMEWHEQVRGTPMFFKKQTHLSWLARARNQGYSE